MEVHGGTGVDAYRDYGATGGTGNPGGSGINPNATSDYGTLGANRDARGIDGTGGLLVIFCKNIMNENGNIEANGVDGKWYGYNGHLRIGGPSGGGSVNIFYENTCTGTENITATGGKISYNDTVYGGNGSVTLTKI